jgi:hypothetical protein
MGLRTLKRALKDYLRAGFLHIKASILRASDSIVH